MATKKLKPKATQKEESNKVVNIESHENVEIKDEFTFSFSEVGLPCFEDSDGVSHDEFVLREITGKDEEAISGGECKNNAVKAVQLLLSRCIISIGTHSRKTLGTKGWEKLIGSLYVGQQDYMLIKLREISSDGEIEIVHKCPECGTELRSFINVDELPVIPYKELVVPFELKRGYKDKNGVVHTQGVLRSVTGLDREILVPIAKKNLAKANTMLLTRLLSFSDDYPVTEDCVSSLVKRDRDYLDGLLKQNIFGVDVSVPITCTNCGTEFQGSVDALNF